MQVTRAWLEPACYCYVSLRKCWVERLIRRRNALGPFGLGNTPVDKDLDDP